MAVGRGLRKMLGSERGWRDEAGFMVEPDEGSEKVPVGVEADALVGAAGVGAAPLVTSVW